MPGLILPLECILRCESSGVSLVLNIGCGLLACLANALLLSSIYVHESIQLICIYITISQATRKHETHTYTNRRPQI